MQNKICGIQKKRQQLIYVSIFYISCLEARVNKNEENFQNGKF